MALRPPEKIVLCDLDEKRFEVWLEAYRDYCRFSKHFTGDDLITDQSLEKSLFLTLTGLEISNLISGLSFEDTFDGLIKAITTIQQIILIQIYYKLTGLMHL